MEEIELEWVEDCRSLGKCNSLIKGLYWPQNNEDVRLKYCVVLKYNQEISSSFEIRGTYIRYLLICKLFCSTVTWANFVVWWQNNRLKAEPKADTWPYLLRCETWGFILFTRTICYAQKAVILSIWYLNFWPDWLLDLTYRRASGPFRLFHFILFTRKICYAQKATIWLFGIWIFEPIDYWIFRSGIW